jgi:hypothetical protein
MSAEIPHPEARGEDRIACHGVGVSAEALWQYDGDAVSCKVQRREVRSCRLEYGSPEPRPMVSVFLGIVLLTPGYIVAGHVGEIIGTGRIHLEHGFGAVFVLFMLMGGWLLYRALFVRRFYLSVVTPSEIRRYAFDQHTGIPEIRRFMQTAESRWGWRIVEE